MCFQNIPPHLTLTGVINVELLSIIVNTAYIPMVTIEDNVSLEDNMCRYIPVNLTLNNINRCNL